MTYIEVRSAQIEENSRLEKRSSRRKRLRDKLSDAGYDGDWTPLLIGITFIYLLISTALTFAGFGNIIGAIAALPLATGGSIAALSAARRKKIHRFEKQLLQVLTSVAGHLESGDVPQMAFQKAAKLVENPLRGELEQVLASRLGSDSLSESMEYLLEKYPSKAMRLLVAALAIDDTVGARLSPALRQAQVILERQFELAAEGSAEISQARGEFYAITGVMAVIALTLLAGSGGQARESYTSTGGVIVISIALLNYAVGIIRARKVFSKAERGR
ncbi:MAG: type II secretion system F family protein [Candidatus Paceibacterota bacterium]